MARKKRKVAQVNNSSSADIAFLLLIFFLVTTSMGTDKGLSRRLPPPIPADQKQDDVDIKQRNILVVMVNKANQLMVNGDVLNVDDLRDRAKEFITNKENDPTLPEKEVIDVPEIGPIEITTSHVIALQNDRDTEYQTYIKVQNELVRAYNELREEFSQKKFGKSYEELTTTKGDELKAEAVRTVYPQKISETEPKKYAGGN